MFVHILEKKVNQHKLLILLGILFKSTQNKHFTVKRDS